jgi:hypothetical protein
MLVEGSIGVDNFLNGRENLELEKGIECKADVPQKSYISLDN